MGQILDQKIQSQKKKQKTPPPNCWISEEPEAKAGYCTHPNTQHHKEVSKPPKLPLQPDPWTHPYTSRLMNELLLPQRVSKGACYLFLLPPAAGIGAPIKPSLNFLSVSSQFLLLEEDQEFWSVSKLVVPSE